MCEPHTFIDDIRNCEFQECADGSREQVGWIGRGVLGHRAYQRLSARRFDRVVLWLLLAAGVGLLLAPAR
jgi:hypothetical protein